MEIIRGGIKEKDVIKNKSYPSRIKISKFEKYNQLLKDKKLQNDYTKWKAGINYNTNKKMIIGGNLYNNLKKTEFDLITKLNNIDIDEYFEETKRLNKNIDNKNILINEKNKKINEYNEKIRNLLSEINKLEKWEDFIMFKGKKYGIPTKVKGDIHVENNCLGKMKFIEQKNIGALSNIRPFCNDFEENEIHIVDCYECEKCNFKEQITGIYEVPEGYELISGYLWKL